MGYEIEKVRVDLEDGQYAVFLKEIRHGTYEAVREVARPFMRAVKSNGNRDSLVTIPVNEDGQATDGQKSIAGLAIEVNLESADFTRIQKVILLNQIVEWSFGDVSEKVLADIPERFFNELSKKVDEIYRPLLVGGVVS